jgi:hypothetical protein
VSHRCKRPACPVTVVDDDRPLCRFDTALVPKPLLQALAAAFDHGRGAGTPAHVAAELAVIEAASRELATTTK